MGSLHLALLWACLMASSFIVSGLITPHASPITTTGLRFGLSLFVMTPLFLQTKPTAEPFFKSLFPSTRILWQSMIISGSLVVFFIGLFTALKTTNSLNVSVMYTLVPLLGAVIAMFMGIQTKLFQWLGYVLGAAGAIAVLLLTRHSDFQWHIGDVVFLGAALALAFHVVAIQCWNSHVPAMTGTYRILFCGALWLLPVTLVWGELHLVQWHSVRFWLLLGYLTVFTTLLTFVLQQKIVSLAGASRLLAFSYTIPIWVFVYRVVTDNAKRELSGGLILGTLMIIMALILIDTNFTPRNVTKRATKDGSAVS